MALIVAIILGLMAGGLAAAMLVQSARKTRDLLSVRNFFLLGMIIYHFPALDRAIFGTVRRIGGAEGKFILESTMLFILPAVSALLTYNLLTARYGTPKPKIHCRECGYTTHGPIEQRCPGCGERI